MDSVYRTAFLFGISLLLCSGLSADDKVTCDRSNACHCVASNGDIYNLESLGFTNGTPRFSGSYHLNDTEPVWITYNPCRPFTEEYCQDAAACYHEQGEFGHKFVARWGTQETSKWTLGTTNQISYSDNEDHLIVELHCNETLDDSFEILNVTENMITSKLTSKCCCANKCPWKDTPSSTTKSKLSTGSVLLILFFSFVVIYFIGGIIYNKVMHGATGKELLPNVEFWSSFPRLVLDGITFTCNCCSRRKGSAAGYDNV